MRKNEIIKPSIHRYFSLLLTVAFFLGLNTLLGSTGINSKSQESKKLMPNVSICFDFDARLKAIPGHVFLKEEEELRIIEKIDPGRVQLYEAGKDIYDFYNIKPGIYRVGFSFKYLLKQKMGNTEVIRHTFVNPAISTDIGIENHNRIEVKKNKRVLVNLKIQLRLMARPEYNEKDPQEYSRVIPRTRPKSPEEELMLDDNYFPLGAAGFDSVERIKSKLIDRINILFTIDVFDDYPFEQQQTQKD